MNLQNYLIHKLFTIILICILPQCTSARHTITGNFPPLAGQKVRLVGFEGFDIYTIDSTKVNKNGRFRLSYASEDRGIGYLAAEDNEAYFVVLADEDIRLKGEVLSVPESVIVKEGKENKLFVQYVEEHRKREQALSAWIYLHRIYEEDSLFAVQQKPRAAINDEIDRIREEDKDFLESLDPESYISWYLPVRKLVSSVSIVAQYRTEEIPQTIASFRDLDHTDHRLYKSGLFRDVIDSHYWLIENMGKPLDSVFIEMNISTDHLVENLMDDEEKLNLITNYLFELMEQRSLFSASEYLALKLLTQNACTIDDNFASQLESYRAMKIGNTAPDIEFEGDVFRNGEVITTPKLLSEIEATHKVVVFGAEWCPMCIQELTQIKRLYTKWNSKGVEVVFVSLDTEKPVFKSFTKIFPFISFSDYKKWDTQAVKEYHVFATPTMFLLDKDHEILLRPHSVNQLDAWVDYYID